MIVKKCDRCKKEITEDTKTLNILSELGAQFRRELGATTKDDYVLRVARYLKYDSNHYTPDGLLDLCPACSKSLFKWFYDTEEVKKDE